MHYGLFNSQGHHSKSNHLHKIHNVYSHIFFNRIISKSIFNILLPLAYSFLIVGEGFFFVDILEPGMTSKEFMKAEPQDNLTAFYFVLLFSQL